MLYDLHGTSANIVLCAYPFHLILPFQRFGHALTLCHLGFKPGKTDVSGGNLDLGGYESIFRQMKDAFGFKYVATTLRESYSASDNGWSALIYDGETFYCTKKYDIRIVDRVGGGDSFSAGLIHALLHGRSFKDAAEFAVAASALKHTIPGDYSRFSEADVDAILKNGTGGRVQR